MGARQPEGPLGLCDESLAASWLLAARELTAMYARQSPVGTVGPNRKENPMPYQPHLPHTADAQRGATVYLAGPSGFTEPGLAWHNNVLIPAVLQAGLVPMDPWGNQSAIHEVLTTMDFGAERRDALRVANLEQGRYDLSLVRGSRAILAVLDGCDVDSGTALEIGYGFALGLLIVGLRTDIRGSGDNEGSEVNLMIETCIEDSGGIYTTNPQEAVDFIRRALL